MTINEKIEYLKAIQRVSNEVDTMIKWVMDYEKNEQTGEYEYKTPTKDSDNYTPYMMYNKLKLDIEALANKL